MASPEAQENENTTPRKRVFFCMVLTVVLFSICIIGLIVAPLLWVKESSRYPPMQTKQMSRYPPNADEAKAAFADRCRPKNHLSRHLSYTSKHWMYPEVQLAQRFLDFAGIFRLASVYACDLA